MSRKACSPVSASRERLLARVKNELFYSGNRLNTTIDDFVSIFDTYLCRCNEARINSSLYSRSPVEYRRTREITA